VGGGVFFCTEGDNDGYPCVDHACDRAHHVTFRPPLPMSHKISSFQFIKDMTPLHTQKQKQTHDLKHLKAFDRHL
jgi:hypothetical protein